MTFVSTKPDFRPFDPVTGWQPSKKSDSAVTTETTLLVDVYRERRINTHGTAF
jgi:hypothetical protein